VFIGRRDLLGLIGLDLRGELLSRHFDAIMATSSAGVARADMY
jgi:hypothetical protein